MAALVFGETDGDSLSKVVSHAVRAAKYCAPDVDVVLIGTGLQAASKQASELEGVRTVIVFEESAFANAAVEDLACVVRGLVPEYDYFVATATSVSRALLPRVAAQQGVAMASEITAVLKENEFLRPTYASNALSTVRLNDKLKVLTVRATAFEAATPSSAAAAIEARTFDKALFSKTAFSATRPERTGRPDLSSARVVVSAGRGLKAPEDFGLIGELADSLGGAVGASRPLVDMGYIGNEHQVGQTGKVVAPELYIAAGVSGAIQHIAGMKDSKVIVAINSDADAPIFQYANYGIVGDLYEIVPALTRRLIENRAAK